MTSQVAAKARKRPILMQPSTTYCSWGQYPAARHAHVHKAAWDDQVPSILESATRASLLPYGLGRSYGDSCLNAERTLIDCQRLNRILGFDESSGILRAESGMTLAEIIGVFLPKGWFLPVTPGTQFVTVGGAIANDVHGKNHHCASTFGAHVRQFGLRRSDHGLVLCSPEQNADMLRATIGGLGLTGVIAWADIQLRRVSGPWIDAELIPFQSLQSFLDISRESDGRFEYTVAWLDCFAGKNPRGIFFRGNHSCVTSKNFKPKRGPSLPFALPECLLNRFTVKAFNTAYYHLHKAKGGSSLIPYDSFFYPLDSIRQWNRLYGRRGFLQYQCVIPESRLDAFEELLDRIARSGMGSFLGVLKRFGNVPCVGMLSFPRPGLTIALDFAMRGESTLQLLRSLDEVVLQSGGALYPAKDARMSPALFESSFPNWRAFVPYIDPKFSSSFWRRVTEER
ncbi:MAG TPA: FAD-binding oxidoreductase [Terriglobales bacterium]|nr:FAD-binding oxidoreductase [Terriglobales bacterium]